MRTLLTTVILLSVLAVIVYVILKGGVASSPTWDKGFKEEERKRIASETEEQQRSADENVAKAVRERSVEKEWKEAVRLGGEFMRTGRGYDAAAAKFRAIQASGTQFASIAETEITRMNAVRDKGVSQALSDIESRVLSLAGEGRYADAVKLCTGYSGKYQEETADRRRELADRYSAEEKKAKLAEEKKRVYCEFKNRILEGIAELVSSEKYKDALELIGKPKMEISAEDAEGFKSLAESLKSLDGMDSLVAEKLKGMIGEKIGFVSKGRLDSGEISRVSGHDIYVRQNLDGKVFETKTNSRALQVPDRLKCTGALPAQARAIYAALLYARDGNFNEAEKNLESAGLIGGYLKPRLPKKG